MLNKLGKNFHNFSSPITETIASLPVFYVLLTSDNVEEEADVIKRNNILDNLNIV